MLILDTVAAKFRNYSASDFVDSIQEEAAFQQTNRGDIIPYSMAKKIRAF